MTEVVAAVRSLDSNWAEALDSFFHSQSFRINMESLSSLSHRLSSHRRHLLDYSELAQWNNTAGWAFLGGISFLLLVVIVQTWRTIHSNLKYMKIRPIQLLHISLACIVGAIASLSWMRIILLQNQDWIHVAMGVLSSILQGYQLVALWYLVVLHSGGGEVAVAMIEQRIQYAETILAGKSCFSPSAILFDWLRFKSPASEHTWLRRYVLLWTVLRPLTAITVAIVGMVLEPTSGPLQGIIMGLEGITILSLYMAVFAIVRTYFTCKPRLCPQFRMGPKVLLLCCFSVVLATQETIFRGIFPPSTPSSQVFVILFAGELLETTVCCVLLYYVFAGDQYQQKLMITALSSVVIGQVLAHAQQHQHNNASTPPHRNAAANGSGTGSSSATGSSGSTRVPSKKGYVITWSKSTASWPILLLSVFEHPVKPLRSLDRLYDLHRVEATSIGDCLTRATDGGAESFYIDFHTQRAERVLL